MGGSRNLSRICDFPATSIDIEQTYYMMMKRRLRCEQTKSLVEFHVSRARTDGHQSICKPCRAEIDRERYLRARDTESRREAKREFDRSRTEWLRSLKTGVPCTDCGTVFPPEAMQWDHLPGRPKRGDVSSLRGVSRQQILDEIANCELVCTNCHILRTIARAGWRLHEPAPTYGGVP